MKISCYAEGCTASIEADEAYAGTPAKYSCREHTERGKDKIRFQTYQFDDRLMGSGADPKAYERSAQPKKSARKFAGTGRSRTKAFEKLEQRLAGVVNAAEIMKVLKKDHENLGPIAFLDSEGK